MHVFTALDDGAPTRALFVGEIHRVGVGHPEINTATGVDPEEMTKSELIAYGMVAADTKAQHPLRMSAAEQQVRI